MKKVLSVILAVMMLFSALAISSSAEDLVEQPYAPHVPQVAIDYCASLRASKVINEDQVIIAFDLMGSGATFKNPVPVYNDNTGTFSTSKNITGIYYMIPNNNDLANSRFQTPNSSIYLPAVTAPNGKDFKGWRYVDFSGNTHVYAAGSPFKIPAGSDSVGVLYFEAVLTTGTIEVSFLDTILDKLIGIVSGLFSTLFENSDMPGLSGLDIGAILGGLL